MEELADEPGRIEAERAEVVDAVGAGLPIAGMSGVVTPAGSSCEIHDGGLPVRFKKLAGIPRPAWDLFPMDAYFRYRSYLGVDLHLRRQVVQRQGPLSPDQALKSLPLAGPNAAR